MDHRFAAHNSFKSTGLEFHKTDPQLRRLLELPLVHEHKLLDQLPYEQPGLYTLTGGRQVGKSTLTKTWIKSILNKGEDAQSIYYITGELIDDHHSLVRIINEEIENSACPLKYLIIDEATYIKNWEKALKFLVDDATLDQVVCIITGSDTALIKEMRTTFPGRRGKAEIVDFHLWPLTFRETVELKNILQVSGTNRDVASFTETEIDLLTEQWKQYLYHGGYLPAINDYYVSGAVSQHILASYADWIRGDMLKHGKREHYLRQIVGAIIKKYASQLSWNSLSKELSIDHPKTVADYIFLLENMDVVFVQQALREDRLEASPKKAKRLFFSDPFIYHALRSWVTPQNYYRDLVNSELADPELSSKLTEGAAIVNYNRYYPVFYIKAEGEVDIAYIHNKRFWPVEVKWTNQLRQKDLKQITKYNNALILGKTKKAGTIAEVPFRPLVAELLCL